MAVHDHSPGVTPRFPSMRLRDGGYESFYVRAVDPARPRGGVAAPHGPQGARRRVAVGSVWVTLFDADAAGPVGPQGVGGRAGRRRLGAHRRASAFGPDGVRGEAGPGVLGPDAGTGAEDVLRHLPRAWMYRAPVPRTKLESPRPSAPVQRPRGGRHDAVRARRLAGHGRPQLGQPARRALDLAARRPLRRGVPMPGSTCRSAGCASGPSRRRGSPRASCSFGGRRIRLGRSREPSARGRGSAARRPDRRREGRAARAGRAVRARADRRAGATRTRMGSSTTSRTARSPRSRASCASTARSLSRCARVTGAPTSSACARRRTVCRCSRSTTRETGVGRSGAQHDAGRSAGSRRPGPSGRRARLKQEVVVGGHRDNGALTRGVDGTCKTDERLPLVSELHERQVNGELKTGPTLP